MSIEILPLLFGLVLGSRRLVIGKIPHQGFFEGWAVQRKGAKAQRHDEAMLGPPNQTRSSDRPTAINPARAGLPWRPGVVPATPGCPPSTPSRQSPHPPGERLESAQRASWIIRARARRSIRLDTAKAPVIQPARLERGSDGRIPISRSSFPPGEVACPRNRVAKIVWRVGLHPEPGTPWRARFHPGRGMPWKASLQRMDWRAGFHPGHGTACKPSHQAARIPARHGPRDSSNIPPKCATVLGATRPARKTDAGDPA